MILVRQTMKCLGAVRQKAHTKEDSAMKKNTNFAFGFTIAELLITMLISAIIAAAMVPIIGLKKVKFPRNRFNHGIAECYYVPTAWNDDTGDPTDWELVFYTADNRRQGGNAGAGGAVNNDHCTFQPPSAEYYEIIVIGAGTDGNQTQPNLPLDGVRPGGNLPPQPISTGSGFQASLNDAQLRLGDGEVRYVGDQLRDIMTAWNASATRRHELFARYILEAPSGGSGRNTCNQIHLNQINPGRYGSCEIPMYTTDVIIESLQSWQSVPPNFCNAFLAREGDPSGRGLQVEVQYNNIDPNSNIVVSKGSNATVLSFPNHLFRLTAAGQGRSPRFNGTDRYDINGPLPVDASCTLNDRNCVVTNTTIRRITELAPIPGNTNFNVQSESNCSSPSNGSHSGRVRFVYSEEGDSTTDEPRDERDAPRSALVWNYNPIEANVFSGFAGEPGEEKSVVYEDLRGTLIMHPAQPQTGWNEDQMGVNNPSFVMTDPNDPRSVLVSARSGQHHGGYEQMTFQMINSDIPIPRDPLHSAKTFDADNFDYVAKLMTTPYNGGLRGCEQVGVHGEWCPGFAGKGVYFYLETVPDAAAISITNRVNNRTFAVPTDEVRRDLIQNDPNFGTCDDNVTLPTFLTNYPFVNAEGQMRDFSMHYCRERKSHGSPGAVIIMW